MGAVLVAVFAPRFDDRSGNPYVLATIFVVALYVSVLVHELAHVAVARGFAMPVRSVTLHLLGGETLIEGESRTPWQELTTAIAGPIASAIIGLASLRVSEALDQGVTADVLWSVGYVNILVAIFNMLPGLPLDGGRVFCAIIWQLTGREPVGVRVAAWLGRAAAVAIVVLALTRDHAERQYVVDLAVALLIGWFLWQGASDALRHAGHSVRVNRLVARTLAEAGAPPPAGAPNLPADLRGIALLRAMDAEPAAAYVLTEPDGSTYGVLRAAAVDQAFQFMNRKERRTGGADE